MTTLFVQVLLLIALSMMNMRNAMAIAPYARQTNMACTACHYQHWPELNAFGRSFKDSGYTMMGGGQKLIEVEGLSLPAAATPGMQVKIDAIKTNAPNPPSTYTLTNMKARGELEFPNDVSLFFGGRIAEPMGYFFELSLMDGDQNNRFSAFRMPIGWSVSDVRLQVVPFTTDSDGPGFGYETLNVGLLRQSLVNRTSTAYGYLGVTGDTTSFTSSAGPSTSGKANATGIAFVASQPTWYINYSLWKNSHGSSDNIPITLARPLHFVRAVAMPAVVSGWDLAAGITWIRGKEDHFDGTLLTTPPGAYIPTVDSVNVTGIDFQAQGKIDEYPTGFYASAAVAPTSGDTPNIFNSTGANNKYAIAFNGELGIVPNKFIVGAGYRYAKNGAAVNPKDNAMTAEFSYYPVLNLELTFNQQWFWKDVPGNNLQSQFRMRAAF